ncbi:MAG: hypothetical protein ACYCW6_07855 [Candidatus Xenobia bacterium]
MNIRKTIAAALMALTLTVSAVPAFAQGEGGHIPYHPRVNQVNHRFENQGDRVQQGVNNGSIGPREQARLQAQGQAFKNEGHAMRTADGGHLTLADKHTLNQQLNRGSREIYRFKHN